MVERHFVVIVGGDSCAGVARTWVREQGLDGTSRLWVRRPCCVRCS